MEKIANSKQKEKKKNSLSIGMLLLKVRTFVVLAILLIVFSFVAPNFTNKESIILIIKHVALYGLLGVGMTLVIITGGIDLSVGSIVGLSAMISGGLIYEGLALPMFGVKIYFNVPIIIILTLISGVIIGLINGIVITKFKVTPFITTLGMLYIARGLALLRSNGATFPDLTGKAELGNTGFQFLGQGTILGIPVAIWIFAIISLIAAFLLKKTPLGWHIYATGGNENAAKLSGILTDRVKLFVYAFSGLCAAFVGLIAASQLTAAQPATGESWELSAIAASVLGGTSMMGGVGTIGGAVIGALIIGVINDGMVMSGVSEFWQQVIRGSVIIIAVIVDQVQRNMEAKMALEQKNA
ncbi:ABC transporter permease [Thermoanaerobacterium sp. CMT5567-10]|uniref:ABC transporter permease n=1 Tax=Thermoanaerobacterium sp. CMT5567-10 TaxID=3061989 RepID=UPI0026E016BA|nr:ABC transporter permease [Thermoanaerobacterium sp. CMT5567-10]WKV10099.1 ABC transporter permease [Thermoanaerobacterium sp. CMT5567-10]